MTFDVCIERGKPDLHNSMDYWYKQKALLIAFLGVNSSCVGSASILRKKLHCKFLGVIKAKNDVWNLTFAVCIERGKPDLHNSINKYYNR